MIVVKKIDERRKFNGETYRLFTVYDTKHDAETVASFARHKGYSFRIIKVKTKWSGKTGYALFIKKK